MPRWYLSSTSNFFKIGCGHTVDALSFGHIEQWTLDLFLTILVFTNLSNLFSTYIVFLLSRSRKTSFFISNLLFLPINDALPIFIVSTFSNENKTSVDIFFFYLEISLFFCCTINTLILGSSRSSKRRGSICGIAKKIVIVNQRDICGCDDISSEPSAVKCVD